MRKRILITGGTGYIGSHTAVDLLEAGYDAIIVDNLSNSRIEVLDGIEAITGKRPDFYKIDLQNNDDLDLFFRQNGKIDAIIHFAALKSVGESVREPLKYYRNNIGSLINLINSATDNKVRNIIFSSSCTVYGEPDEIPVKETSPMKEPSSPYGNTKRISEDILRDAAKVYDLNIISLRYFNPIGAHPSGLIGELPSGEPENLLPYITQTAAGVRKELKIFGNDYDTPDGYNIRDYIHVADLARAHTDALKRLQKKQEKKRYEVFNLGTGRGYSTMEVVKEFERISGLKLNYKVVGRRPGDVAAIYSDAGLANKELGWKAKRDLGEMLRSAWKWEKRIRNIKN